jgi:hypothetical protein
MKEMHNEDCDCMKNDRTSSESCRVKFACPAVGNGVRFEHFLVALVIKLCVLLVSFWVCQSRDGLFIA